MKCPYLKGKYMITCTSVKEGYIPSIFELEEFCRHAKHTLCPLYRTAREEGKAVITSSPPFGMEVGS